MKDLELTPLWMRVALNPMTGVLIRDREEIETQKRSHVRTEAEMGGGVMATSPGTPGAPEAGKGRKDPLLEHQEGAQPCLTWISDFWSPELQ